MSYDIKVFINRLGNKLIAKFTSEDMKKVYASRLTLRELAQFVMPFNSKQCTLHHDGIAWTAEPGDWDDMDTEDIQKGLEDMLTNT
jgi:hypothetical protein